MEAEGDHLEGHMKKFETGFLTKYLKVAFIRMSYLDLRVYRAMGIYSPVDIPLYNPCYSKHFNQ